MEKQSLYEIQKQMLQLSYALEVAENDEAKETLEACLEQLRQQADTRHAEYVEFIAEMDAQVAKYDLELERCIKIKKTLQGRKERVKSVLQDWVKGKGGKVQLDTKTLSIRKNPESIKIDNEDLIINKLDACEVKYTISKTKLKQYLLPDGRVLVDGEQVAHVEQSESLVIK